MQFYLEACISRYAKCFFCYLLIICFLYNFAAFFPAVRVGDGEEYYALYYSWMAELRPWMSSNSYELYNSFVSSGAVSGVMGEDVLSQAFPDLHLGGTSDFNHFWLYSFFAFLIGSLANLFYDFNAHQSFLLLHAMIFIIPLHFSYSYYRWAGAASVLLLAFASPLIWYVDKVHTEWFTFCFTLAGVICFSGKRYLLSSLLISIAATQNISFALIAFFPFVVGVNNSFRQGFTLKDTVLILIIALLVLLHPTYYFFRYGVITPQLLAGGASSSPDILSAYIWLFDPDVGLMSNWALGTIACACFLYYSVSTKLVVNKLLCSFLFFFLVVNLLAHSSTSNINSGATPGISRYALWYMPLFFVIFLHLISFVNLAESKLRVTTSLFISALLVAINYNFYSPIINAHYVRPTAISLFLQTNLPSWYSPKSEIFFERYSGLGENWGSINDISAVVGPDCRKVLVYTDNLNKKVLSPKDCFFDNEKLQYFFSSGAVLADKSSVLKVNKKGDIGTPDGLSSKYVLFNVDVFDSARRQYTGNEFAVGGEANGSFILGAGWSGIESWGVWSESDVMELLIPCTFPKGMNVPDSLVLNLSLGSFVPQDISILVDQKVLVSDHIDSPKKISVEIPVADCSINYVPVFIHVSNPTSPSSISSSQDARRLAISLSSFQLTAR